MKKKVGICSILLGLILIGKEVVSKIMVHRAISIIGGADGPTSVFLAGKLGWPGWFEYSGWVAGILLLVIGMGLVLWKRKKEG